MRCRRRREAGGEGRWQLRRHACAQSRAAYEGELSFVAKPVRKHASWCMRVSLPCLPQDCAEVNQACCTHDGTAHGHWRPGSATHLEILQHCEAQSGGQAGHREGEAADSRRACQPERGQTGRPFRRKPRNSCCRCCCLTQRSATGCVYVGSSAGPPATHCEPASHGRPHSHPERQWWGACSAVAAHRMIGSNLVGTLTKHSIHWQ